MPLLSALENGGLLRSFQYIWPTKFGPSYAKSYGIVLSMFGATILVISSLPNPQLSQGD